MPTQWGLVSEGGTINPLQAGAVGDGVTDDRSAIQACIDFIDRWNTRTVVNATYGRDSSNTAIKLIIPANRTFLVDARPKPTIATGLVLKGPITIKGEDRLTSRIRLLEDSISTDDDDPQDTPDVASLFRAENIDGITFRNFTMLGSYGPEGSLGPDPDGDNGERLTHGNASLLTFKKVEDVLLESMVFTRNRAVLIGGDGIRNLTMRGCRLSDSRRGGIVIGDVENIVIESNEFRWVPDDPIAISISGSSAPPPPVPPDPPLPPWLPRNGGTIRISGNSCFGCRGINVVGAKNVIIADNTHVLGRGRAIHVGCTTFQTKGDTTTLNVVVRGNIITDLLNAQVDPRPDRELSGHRAIDIELLDAAPGRLSAIPGLTDGSQSVYDPTREYYTDGQGLQGAEIWKSGQTIELHDKTWWLGRIYEATIVPVGNGTTVAPPPTHASGAVTYSGIEWTLFSDTPTPHAANLLIEGNIISRSRPPAVPNPNPDHVTGFNSFADYVVGPLGSAAIGRDQVVDPIEISLDHITPSEGIAVMGGARGITIRGNQIRNCDTGIALRGDDHPLPFSLLDVTIEGNELSDWTTAGIRFSNYAVGLPQRVTIRNNRADGDPFHRNQYGTVRKSGGQWADTASAIINVTPNVSAGTGSFIDTGGVGMIVIVGNHVRNVAQLIHGLSDALHVMRDNVGYCDPAAINYSSSNKGVGNVIEPARGWHYVIENGNPGSVDYGKLINTCPRAASSVTSGSLKWVQGMVVTNLAPSAVGSGTTRYEVSGWRRMTTSASNTLNADWREQRVLIGP